MRPLERILLSRCSRLLSQCVLYQNRCAYKSVYLPYKRRRFERVLRCVQSLRFDCERGKTHFWFLHYHDRIWRWYARLRWVFRDVKWCLWWRQNNTQRRYKRGRGIVKNKTHNIFRIILIKSSIVYFFVFIDISTEFPPQNFTRQGERLAKS